MRALIKNLNWKPIVVIFIMPALILHTWFLIIPLFTSLGQSLYHGQLLEAKEFVGLDNFIKLFTQQPFKGMFLNALKNNLIFLIIIMIFQNFIPLIISIILSRKFIGANFFRTVYFLPTTIATIMTGFLFRLILNPVWGITGKILSIIGLGDVQISWLGNKHLVLPVIALVSSWQYMGMSIILYTAAISSINKEIIEAAKVDGASEIRIARHIIIPSIIPVMGIVFILYYIGNFLAFDIPYAMATSKGIPGYAADLLGLFFYRTTFGGGIDLFAPDVGLGAAIATVIFIIIIIGVTIWFLLNRKNQSG